MSVCAWTAPLATTIASLCTGRDVAATVSTTLLGNLVVAGYARRGLLGAPTAAASAAPRPTNLLCSLASRRASSRALASLLAWRSTMLALHGAFVQPSHNCRDR